MVFFSTALAVLFTLVDSGIDRCIGPEIGLTVKTSLAISHGENGENGEMGKMGKKEKKEKKEKREKREKKEKM